MTGTFSFTNGLNIGNGEILNVIYGSNFVELSTASIHHRSVERRNGCLEQRLEWSIGVPQPAFDTIIYSGGNDLVTLDCRQQHRQLAGGRRATNGFSSELTDGGTAQNLTITQGLSVGANGFLNLTGASTITAATMSNSGDVYVGPTATISLTNQPLGITDAVANSTFTLWGTFNAGSNSGFANLNSVEGYVDLNGQSFTITPGTGTLTISSTGGLEVDYNNVTSKGSNVTITGNVNNSGIFVTGGINGQLGPSMLTVTGTVTNSTTGQFLIDGNGDQAFVGGLVNNFNVYVSPGATLTLTAQPGGITDIVQGSIFDIAGTFKAGSNNAMAGLTSVEGSLYFENGQTTSITPAGGTLTVSNTALIYPSFGSTVDVNGNVNNAGLIATTHYTGGGSSQFNVTGTLTNSNSFILNGPGDMSTVGSLTDNAGGFVDVGGGGSTLTVTGNVVNNAGGPQGIYTSFSGPGGNTININGNLTNNGKFGLESTGDD